MPSDRLIFRSKISVVPVIILAVALGSALILLAINSEWILLCFFTLITAFVVQMFLTTNYRLEGEQLLVRCGFLYRLSIDVRTIRRIEETRNPLSAPALSFDRLEIIYGRYDSVIISPRNKQDFITCLKNIAPEIEVKRNR